MVKCRFQRPRKPFAVWPTAIPPLRLESPSYSTALENFREFGLVFSATWKAHCLIDASSSSAPSLANWSPTRKENQRIPLGLLVVRWTRLVSRFFIINDRRPMGYISPPFRCTAHQFPRAMIGGHYQSDVWLARLTFRNSPTLSADYQVIFSTHV